MTRFVPSRFALYEFDDRDQQAGPVRRWLNHWAGPVRRWLNHWDGALGQPAEEVTLAWSVDDAVVLVCTSGRDYDHAEARSRAAHLALGGDTLPVANQSADVADSDRHSPRSTPDPYVKLAAPMPFYLDDVSLNKPHRPRLEGHSCSTTRPTPQLRRWI